METKKRVRLLVLIVFVAVLLGSGYTFFLLPQINRYNVPVGGGDTLFGWKFPSENFPPKTGVPANVAFKTTPGTRRNLFDFEIAFSDIRDPGGLPQGLPVRLQIPVIGVDSVIEDAEITPDGRMDVPQGSVNVAWFSLGPHPGQVGSAVIGGHFGISDGVPFVFYNLNKLSVGNKIYIINDEGETLAFIVRNIRSFQRTDDATPVFTSHDGLAHLNLITCEGIWNRVNGTYPQRLVIFTDAIPPGGPVGGTPGAGGDNAVRPALPSTAMTSAAPSFSRLVQSSFDTPLDALVTSLLLAGIGFVAFKIFRLRSAS